MKLKSKIFMSLLFLVFVLALSCTSKEQKTQHFPTEANQQKDSVNVIRKIDSFEIVERFKKKGVRQQEKQIVPIVYDKIDWRNWKTGDSLYFFGYQKKSVDLYSQTGRLIFEDYQSIIFQNNGRNMMLLKKNGLYGLADENGRIILPLEYENLDNWISVTAYGLGFGFENSGFMTIRKNNNLGIVNVQNSQIIIPPMFNDIYYHNDVFVVIDSQGKKGAYSLQGKEILAPVFDKLDNWNDDVFAVSSGGKTTIITCSENKKIDLPECEDTLFVCGNYLLLNHLLYTKDGDFLLSEVDEVSEFTLYDENKNPIGVSQDSIVVLQKEKVFVVNGHNKKEISNFRAGKKLWLKKQQKDSENIYTMCDDELFNLGRLKRGYDYK